MTKPLSTPQHHLTPETGELPLIPATEKLLPLQQVESCTGFKSSFLYQLIKSGKFPAPVKIGTSSRWRESEIQAWKSTAHQAKTRGVRHEQSINPYRSDATSK